LARTGVKQEKGGFGIGSSTRGNLKWEAEKTYEVVEGQQEQGEAQEETIAVPSGCIASHTNLTRRYGSQKEGNEKKGIKAWGEKAVQRKRKLGEKGRAHRAGNQPSHHVAHQRL